MKASSSPAKKPRKGKAARRQSKQRREDSNEEAQASKEASEQGHSGHSHGVHPVHQVALSYGLDESVAQALVAGGITSFFPVQELAVPPILFGSYGEWGLSQDVCVSAPTGSGKTLIYVAVTLQAVCLRVVPALVSGAKALVPSADLTAPLETRAARPRDRPHA